MTKAPKAPKAQEAQAEKSKSFTITETAVHAALEAAYDPVDPLSVNWKPNAEARAKAPAALALYDQYTGPFKLTKTPIPRGVQELARELRKQ